ncbi:MAG: hypothetical protein KA007_03050 [Candidatus Pacebacteria bacterium]|jgi:hypothetical protein|nr:hypothetical protein [Candidatus Paceibacterota bacterium]
MNFNISLKNALSSVADAMLPPSSGQNKMLEIFLKMIYQNNRFQHVKVVFWRPNNCMLVAYNFDTHLEDISDDDFSITANHDSTWKYDGLNFFHNIVKEPQEIDMLSCKIVAIENAFASDTDRTFFFNRTEEKVV